MDIRTHNAPNARNKRCHYNKIGCRTTYAYICLSRWGTTLHWISPSRRPGILTTGTRSDPLSRGGTPFPNFDVVGLLISSLEIMTSTLYSNVFSLMTPITARESDIHPHASRSRTPIYFSSSHHVVVIVHRSWGSLTTREPRGDGL